MSGLIFSEIRDSCDDKDEVLCGLFILGLISSIFLSVIAIQGYYEKKEYPAAKYELEMGKEYSGECRNAARAVWDGKKFTYTRHKFGSEYQEHINHYEDDDGYDVFVPIKVK